jgi:large repetitive protein
MRDILRARRTVAAVAAAVLGLTLAVTGAAPAQADTAPPVPTLPETVAADGLPTVQIDGVVWDQAIVGNRVYVVGSFTTARPAGSAPGVNTVARANMLAYDLTTGALITSFAPTLNAQARSLAVSPDGTTLYVGGEFTQVNGAVRYRVAAFNAATGALLSYAPVVNARVAVVHATNSTLYIGGIFSQAGGQNRTRVAALSTATGLALPFTATPNDGQVNAMALSPDESILIVGGSFTSLNGSSSPGYGLARLDATTGAPLALSVNGLVRNGGTQASIFNLDGDARGFYGVGYVFGSGGNLEGAFSASWDGDLRWLEDCHGDSYDVYTEGDVTYTVGHPHYCSTVGGYPQYEPWQAYYTNAYTNFATGPLGRNEYGGYYNFEGTPGPTLLNYFPTLTPGAYTGASQAAWTVTGNGTYVVYGGEFTHVNGTRQQGLVRMAVKEVAPNKQGPRLAGDTWPLKGVSLAAGTARLTWAGNFDRDNETLVYKVYRTNLSTVIDTKTVTAPFWKLPQMGFVDTGQPAGSTQRYRVSATDPFGNTSYTPWIDVVIGSGAAASPYASAVKNDSPLYYWRMGEPSGTSVYDWAGFNDATASAGVTRGAAGAVGDSDTAATFSGNDTGLVVGGQQEQGRNTFAIEAWFKTTTTAGGKIVGFGRAASGGSSSYDRHVYMDPSGKLNFGVYPGTSRVVVSSAAYNDGAWHHVVANLGPAGMSMYVDDRRVGQRADTTSGENYPGYWRIGGDNSWAGAPYFAGSIDDVAIYGAPLTAQQVDSHWVAAGRTSTIPAPPADAYGAAVFQASPDLYWRLGEASGTTAADSGPLGNNGTYRGGVSLNQTGAIIGTTNKAARFNGGNALAASNATFNNPTTYTEELWFKTTTTSGGKLIGFGDAASGTSSNYDRHVYMENDGRLTFGVWTGTANTITTPAAYNDGAWHHMVATQGPSGMVLYVDGVARGTHPQTGAQAYTGYWRIGGDTTWGPQPWFAGTLDDVAVYSNVLSAATVAQHWQLGSGAQAPNQAPTAAFTTSVDKLKVSLDAGDSADSDGTVASYAWSFQGGGSATGETATHTFASAGTYNVTLVVTDDDGATATLTKQVTVVANQAPTAAFTSSVDKLKVSLDAGGSADSDGTVASYAWSFEGGGSATGETATHTFASAGTYDVTLVVTDDDGATGTLTKQVTVVANQAPTAAFSTSTDGLTVSVDAAASADADGTIASYAWSYEGGGSDTGKTASHTFASGGTYDVTLVVTDDEGKTGTLTKQVTVTAPPPNAPPTAAFTTSVAGGVVQVDAGGSTDSDGTITGYAWSAPDATTPTKTGATASFTFTSSGSHTIKLTVTDDDGATDSLTKSVTVTIPTTLARDAFGRTVTDGWGSADIGGAWTLSGGATNFLVASGVAKQRAALGANVISYLPGVSSTGTDSQVDVSLDQASTGGGIYVSLIGRRVDATNDYRARVRFWPGGPLTLQAQNGATTLSAVDPGITYATGDKLRVRLQVFGTSPTTVRARVWKVGSTEPTTWQVNVTSSTAAAQAPGSVGLHTYLSASSTNAPNFVTFDNLVVEPTP